MTEPKYYRDSGYPSVMFRFDQFEEFGDALLCRRTQVGITKYNKNLDVSRCCWVDEAMGWAIPSTEEEFSAILQKVQEEVNND